MISTKICQSLQVSTSWQGWLGMGSTQMREQQSHRSFHPAAAGRTGSSPQLRPMPRLAPPEQELLEEQELGRAGARRAGVGFCRSAWGFLGKLGCGPRQSRARGSAHADLFL